MAGEVFTVEGHGEGQGQGQGVGERKYSNASSSSAPSGGCWGARHTLALMLMLALTVEYCMRVNVAIAVVAMVGHNTTGQMDHASDVCPPRNDSGSVVEDVAGEFTWTEPQQGLVLGSFYYGYTATNLAGGRLAEHLGGRLVVGLAVVVSSVLTFFGPLCARTSFGLFVASRVVAGMVQGVTFPALTSLLATWYPQKEKPKFAPFVYSGMQVGTVIALALGGVLSSSDFLGGWPSVFYVFGAFGLVWGVPWFLLIHDRPENHPRITREELQHIQSDPGTVKGAEVAAVPWCAIFTSPAMWSCFVMAWGSSFGFFTLLNEMPTYLVNIQHLAMDSSGLLSAAPYLCMIPTGIAWGFFMDALSSRQLLSITAVRKLSTAIASLVPAAALLAVCLVECSASLALVMLCLAVTSSATSYSGSFLAEQDIAPNLSATLLGLTNTVGAATGFAAPAIVGAITEGRQGSLTAWRTVFIVASVNYVVTTIIYLFTMSAKVQPWAAPNKAKDTEVELE